MNKSFHFLPDAGAFCAEGPQDFLKRALKLVKLRSSGKGNEFKQSSVAEGSCQSVGYITKSTKRCFINPDAAIFLDNNYEHEFAQSEGTFKKLSHETESYSFSEIVDLIDDFASGDFAFGLCKAAVSIS